MPETDSRAHSATKHSHWHVGLAMATLWSWRFLVSVCLVALWAGFLLLVFALGLPAGIPDGLFCNFEINVLLGILTLVYFAALLPMLLLPLDNDQRFTWFLYAGYGWLFCLLGSVAALRWRGIVEIEDLAFQMGQKATASGLAALFLVPMAASLFLTSQPRRRVAALVTLLVAWLAAEVVCLAQGPGASNTERFALVMLSALWVLVVVSVVLPTTAQLRQDLFNSLMLLWWLLLTASLCLQLVRGRISVVEGDGWESFVCLLITTLLAPMVGWMGMPWTAGRRFAWGICLTLALALVLLAVFAYPVNADLSLTEHVWRNYDGPNLLPWKAALLRRP